jgi:hypothetical protein
VKSTNNLSANLTKTLLIILGIVVAVLLTLNSGMMGDAASLTSGFQFLTADNLETSQSVRIDQLQHIVTVGKEIYQHVSEILINI